MKTVNKKYQEGNYSIGNLSELINKFDNKKIKGLTDFEQVQIFNALKYFDMYQKVGTIEKFMELKQNTEQNKKDCNDKWIYCGDGNNLPKDREWYMTTCVVNNGDPFSTELYFNGKNFDKEEIENDFWPACTMTVCTILAWQPIPNPYHKP